LAGSLTGVGRVLRTVRKRRNGRKEEKRGGFRPVSVLKGRF